MVHSSCDPNLGSACFALCSFSFFFLLASCFSWFLFPSVFPRSQKPSNVLLNSDCHVKLCDFGLARSVAEIGDDNARDAAVLTDYVATRWFRSPELLLGSTRYSKAVDSWWVSFFFFLAPPPLHMRPDARDPAELGCSLHSGSGVGVWGARSC